jgi:cytochrome c-type biogenesis protein CcmH
MMLWAIFAALTLVVLAALLLPLLRRAPQAATRMDYDLLVYRQQLSELDRDQERGVLGADQAEAARTEIHRHMLAAEDAEPAPPRARRARRWAPAAILAAGLPLTALSLYIFLGSPALPGRPFAARQSDPAFQMSMMADKLAARLKAAPDGQGYRRLADAYMMLQRYDDAGRAYQKAQDFGVTDATMLSSHGEALVMQNDGMVVPEARHLFQQSLAADGQDPLSRYYLALAEAQIGNFKKAVAIWRDLEKDSKPDAPWLGALRDHITDAAKQGDFDAAGIAPAPPSVAPSGDRAAAIAAQSPADQAQMIRGMVEGLAARLKQQPDDFDGWMRLALSYKVLGEPAKAMDAAHHAITLRPQAVEPHLALAQIQLGAADEDNLPADFLATMKDVLAIDASNPTALYYLGVAATKQGNNAEARRLWEKLLAGLAPDTPERAEITQRLAALPR